MDKQDKTPIGNKGNCLNCGEVKRIASAKGFCDKCMRLDKLGYKSENDIPWKNCECTPGCPKLIRAFTYRGKEIKYYIGHQVKGARNPRWNNGEYTDDDGYKHIRSPTHPFKDVRGYILKSHLVYEIFTTLKTGKIFYVPRGYDIHHIDWNRKNDTPNNLKLLPKEIHDSLKDGQRYKPKDKSDWKCYTCGISEVEYNRNGRKNIWYNIEGNRHCYRCYRKIRKIYSR